MPNVSFRKDIAPIFHQFRAAMMWRFDLTKYEDVKANASAILTNIEPNGGMPPPPFPPLTAEQVSLFQQWIAEQFPE
ncbi:MAG TPA: hypothetical protein VGZ73_19630 [Bryobacteraceae bacterium]|nr:hypothetical protein [Bryobacteraceae bacterium]